MESIKTHLHSIHLMYDLHNIWEHLLQQHANHSQIIVLTDSNTTKHCLPALLASCPINIALQHIEIVAGEANKNISTAENVWKRLMDMTADRSALLINLGGGVVSDLGGWVAANYKRGIEVINLPTTLLAMVDASAGGKTAINFMDIKNMIGLFSQPKAVYVCPTFLSTLPVQQVQNGFAEMLKHALIANSDYWQQLKNIDPTDSNAVAKHIWQSVRIKAAIVEADPYEKHERKKLNFGHTIGHLIEHWAFEQNCNLLHGEAVALGIWIETYLSVHKSGLNFDEADEIMGYISQHYKAFPLPNFNLQSLEKALLQDKKTKDKKLLFSLLKNIGKADINYICNIEEVAKALRYYQEHFPK